MRLVNYCCALSVFIGVCLPDAVLAAQDQDCLDGMVVNECWHKLINDETVLNSEVRKKIGLNNDLLRSLPTASVLPTLASAVNDFLPVNSVLGSLGVDGDQLEDYLGTHYRPFESTGLIFGLFGNTAPELLGPLQKALEDRGDGDRIRELENALDLSDDLLAEVKMTPSLTPYLGRDWGNYESVFNDILGKGMKSDEVSFYTSYYNNCMLMPSKEELRKNEITNYASCSEGNPGYELCLQVQPTCAHEKELHEGITVGELKQDHPAQYELIKMLAKGATSGLEAMGRSYELNNLAAFGHLINNQPQVVLGIRQLERENTVNAGIRSYSVTFETGLANLALFRLFSSEDCIESSTTTSTGWSGCVDELRDYTLKNAKLLKHSPRISLSYEHSEIEDISVELPFSVSSLTSGGGGLLGNNSPSPSQNDGFVNDRLFEIPGTDRRKFSAAFGMIIIPPEDERGYSVRGDLVYAKEKHRSNLYRNDRELFRATITVQKDEFGIPINLVYRDESEFKNDIGLKDVVALVGLRWNILPKIKPLQP